MWKNELTDQSAKSILAVLESYNRTLKVIDLADNLIESDKKLDQIEEYLIQNRMILQILHSKNTHQQTHHD